MATKKKSRKSAAKKHAAKNKTTDGKTKKIIMFCHLIGLTLIGPPIAWLVWRKQAAIKREAKEATNFAITFLFVGFLAKIALWYIPSLLTTITVSTIGFIWLLFIILASVIAYKKGSYRYPIALRIIP